MVEPKQQRGRARRASLLRAAIDLLAEGGAKAVTHRAVAARAGVPLGLTTYYFASIDQLVDQALRSVTSERVARLDAFATRPPRREDDPEQLARAFVTAVVGRPTPDIIAQIELYLEAARDPAKRGLAAATIEAFERVAANALTTVGGDRPDQRRIGVAITALVDGFALHRVARPLPVAEEVEIMLTAMRALFYTYIADDADLETWRVRLQAAAGAADGEPAVGHRQRRGGR